MVIGNNTVTIELLNPHGSDETAYIPIDKSLFNLFLTHTVQMKLDFQDKDKDKVFLLNPHGSDETPRRIRSIGTSKPLLNPHGSDETGLEAHYKPSYTMLLNPHGSDETLVIYSLDKTHTTS